LPAKASHSLFKSLPSKTGVYTIFSMPSNKFYIGSTSNLDARFFNHYCDAKIIKNRPLYSEVYKVGGFNNFL
jgi:predicted GIY-YIG superfamily endonuclease